MTADQLILHPDPLQPEDPTPKRSGRRIMIVAGLVAAVGFILVTSLLPAWLTTSDAPAESADTNAPIEEGRRIQATLYYVSESGARLVETSRSVLYGETSALQVRRLVEAQIAAPPEGLLNPIPTGTKIHAAFVTDAGEAYVDFGGAFQSAQTGGSLTEALAVYAVVNVITVNLPDITGVQILVDSREVDSMTGHLDLRAPLAKSLAWVEGNERTATANDTN